MNSVKSKCNHEVASAIMVIERERDYPYIHHYIEYCTTLVTFTSLQIIKTGY